MVRGIHSTGVLMIKRNMETVVVKDTVLPYKLMREREYTSNVHNCVGLMGHNRAATKGSIKKENAHPFTKGDITLAHNGTLHTTFRLPDNKDFEVDSENIAHAVNKLGIKEAYKVIQGPAALTFWNSKEHTLNVISNHERPFHYCLAHGGQTIIWSSDEDILKEALGRNGVKVSDKGQIYKPIKNRLYTCSIGKKNALNVVKTDLEEFVFPVISHNHNHNQAQGKWGEFGVQSHSHHPGWRGDRRDGRVGHGSVSVEEDTTADVIPFKQDNTKRELMSEKEFHTIYKECIFCGEDLAHEFERAVILDAQSASCGDCAETATQHHIRIS